MSEEIRHMDEGFEVNCKLRQQVAELESKVKARDAVLEKFHQGYILVRNNNYSGPDGYKEGRKALYSADFDLLKIKTKEEKARDRQINGTAKHATVPVWCNFSTVPDPEVTVLICEEMMDILYNMDFEDSRTVQNVLIEAAHLFCEKHASEDPYYWTERDILDDIDDFVIEVIRRVRDAGEAWYNTEHHTMHGKSHLRDIMNPEPAKEL